MRAKFFACKAVLVVAALWGNPVHAQSITGNTLYEWLNSNQQDIWALMYIRGFIEGQPNALPLSAQIAGRPVQISLVCAPAESTVRQAGDLVKQALANSPQTRHESAPSLIRKAFFEAGWICR